ncbi:unnamed protein product [Didymodactylos carnosus]|uniref:Coiled-coil domain-containing protein 181 n=1 Tax=Didymodactylos carnosus TaxID=1234261 RepID=A0A814B682_9BILA|nr:unnamed protein product [Didymodactylos carnosus]CAF3700799.1 unnamed protein product [Didymodactylos carnosus]
MAIIERPNQFFPYDRVSLRNNYSSFSDNSYAPTRRSFGASNLPRPGQHLDDSDLLALKHQYANIGLREQNMLSNSAEDLSQSDPLPFQFGLFGNEYNDIDANMEDDDDLHFGIDHNYDYDVVIKERLKKANAEFEHDQTPAELNHRQRVSFDAVVKAVDIIQDDDREDESGMQIKRNVTDHEEDNDSDLGHQSDVKYDYIIFEFDLTQPKSGPTLLQQLKAMQFHGALPLERFSPRDDQEEMPISSVTSNNQNTNDKVRDLTSAKKATTTLPNESSNSNPMVVAINGVFDLKNEDDYLARKNLAKQQTSHNDIQGKILPPKVSFESRQPIITFNENEPKKATTLSPLKRPKSSDVTSSRNRINFESKPDSRPKSASTMKSTDISLKKSTSGVNFAELNRNYIEKKKYQQKEDLRLEREAQEKRDKELLLAKASFDQWLKDKDSERKRLEEDRRKKEEEEKARQSKEDEENEKKRKKIRREWEEKKRQQTMNQNELRKLQEEEEEDNESADTIKTGPGHRAFRRWLRQKYEQSLEEKRQLRLEAKKLRRRQKKSLTRYRLDQDLQLAKSFGYS